MRAFVFIGLVLTALSVACASEEADTVDRDEYVDLYVELLRVSAEADDSTEAVHRRAEVLERHGRTLEELTAFAERHAADPDYMAEVWLTIERRLRADTARDGESDDTTSRRESGGGVRAPGARHSPVG